MFWVLRSLERSNLFLFNIRVSNSFAGANDILDEVASPLTHESQPDWETKKAETKE